MEADNHIAQCGFADVAAPPYDTGSICPCLSHTKVTP